MSRSDKPFLQVGKTYKNRLGEEHHIIKRVPHATFPLVAVDSRRRLVPFRLDGSFQLRGEHERDLINED